MRKSIEISSSYLFSSNMKDLHFSLQILSFYFFEISQELQIFFVLLFIILKQKGICCGFWSCESLVWLTLMNLHYTIYQKLKILNEQVGFCDQRKQANSDGFFYFSLLLQIGKAYFINQIPKIVEMIFFSCLRLPQARLTQKNEDSELYVKDCFGE